MGLHGNPLRILGPPPTEQGELRVVSCNVQGFRPRFGEVVSEISAVDPDIVLFQEAYDDHELLHTYFAEWNLIRESNHLVASRFPIRLLEKCHSEPFDRVTSICVEVKTPHGIVHAYSVHQTSQRETLTAVRPWSVITGNGVEELESETLLRDLEAAETRTFINEGDPQYPTIYAGDFNMTRESSLYRNHWGDLPNAFDEGGWGYGYTGLNRTRRFWPEGFPWVKVDHILMTPHWQALECRPGTSNGSDHRLIMARLRLTLK
jgi:endonuclease/exonuclease/phosphatase family metal-dependent hydrolase